MLNGQSFTWKATSDAVWEDGANWDISPVGDAYPNADGNGTDTVTFNSTANGNCRMQSNETVRSLTINLYTGTLQAVGNLTVNNPGGSAGSMNSGEILQTVGGSGSTFAINGGTFTITAGSINHDATVQSPAKLTVGSAGTLEFLNGDTTTVPFGDDLTNDGIVELNNLGEIELYYQPHITNNSDGDIFIGEGNPLGLTLPSGNHPVDIVNTGYIDADVPSGNSYAIQDPIANNTGGEVWVASGELDFTAQDATNNFSFIQQGGSTYLYPGTILGVSYGLWQNTAGGGGLIEAYIPSSGASGPFSSIAPATIEAAYTGQQVKIDAGEVTVGREVSSNNATQLSIKEATLNWNAGTFNFFYDVGRAHATYLVCSQGYKINIATTNTTVTETVWNGTSPIPNLNVMQTSLAVISNLAANDPAGFTASLTNGSTDYTLAPNGNAPSLAGEARAPKGGGRFPLVFETLLADGRLEDLAPSAHAPGVPTLVQQAEPSGAGDVAGQAVQPPA